MRILPKGWWKAPSTLCRLITFRLSSILWPCKYLAGGCCALPERGSCLLLPGPSSDNVGGHCRVPPSCPSTTEVTGLSWSTHKIWRIQHNLWNVSWTPPPGSDQVPPAHLDLLYFTGRRTLLSMHRSLGTDGSCRSLATQVTRLWFPPP